MEGIFYATKIEEKRGKKRGKKDWFETFSLRERSERVSGF